MMYKEIQKFNQPWIMVMLSASCIFMSGIFGFGIYRQMLLGQKFGNNPMSNTALIIVTILVLTLFILLLVLFGFARLTTIIDDKGIRYRFFPFHSRFYELNWTMIERCEVISYNPLREYGGWGIRPGRGGKAYNVSGNKGLQIYLKTGKKILIGTLKDKELIAYLSETKKAAGI
jgi:hypothetical protein